MTTPYQDALIEWTGVLAQLWTAIGKPIDPDRLRIYRDQLKFVPQGLLELAINRVMRESTWHTVPAIGVIWQAIRKELGDPYDLDIALREWSPPYRRELVNQDGTP
jgi:hypothetical protein